MSEDEEVKVRPRRSKVKKAMKPSTASNFDNDRKSKSLNLLDDKSRQSEGITSTNTTSTTSQFHDFTSKPLNLSEEDSSDDDLNLNVEKAKPLTGTDFSDSAPSTSTESNVTTTYDFSGILKLQNDLMQARKRFDTCVATYDHKDDLESSSVKKPLDVDECSIKELLRLGESNTSSNRQESRSSTDDEPCPQSVEITLPSYIEDKEERRRRNKEINIAKHLNQVRNERQRVLHKVHLLCLIAHGNYVNHIINSDLLFGRALSFLPREMFPRVPGYLSSNDILRLLKWFVKTFPVRKYQKPGSFSFEKLEQVFINLKTCSIRDSVFLFVCLLRGLGMTARIVINLTPVPLKAKKEAPSSKQFQNSNLDVPFLNTNVLSKTTESFQRPRSHKKPSPSKSALPIPGPSTSRGSTKTTCSPNKKAGPSSKIDKVPVKKSKIPALKASGTKSVKSTPIMINNRSSARASSVARCPGNLLLLDSSSSSEDETESKIKCAVDYWAEVFIDDSDSWMSVDIVSSKVDCNRELSNRCTQPISYILGWKNDGSVKDVTRRYAPNWVTKKHRVELDWWAMTLKPHLCKDYELDVMEDDQINELMEKAPMPTSINELKNHPLYCLPRHLLKYEAIYPKDSVPLGYIKGEPVYSRYCVHVLCSREKWLQQGKSVKLGEIPYKSVKSRSKNEKFDSETVKPQLELFGSWQVQDYIPPIAVNGVVPKNSYGNVELYTPSMLPRGTVHLTVPNLLKIARKLDIDCAPAVIGWQHHCGRSHPVIDGVVVCQEYQDILLDAWNSEVDQTESRYALKRKTRAKKNWQRITKSVLIRERLKKKYNFGVEEQKDEDEPLPKLPKK